MTGSRRRATGIVAATSGLNSVAVALQAVVLIPMYVRALGTRLYGAWIGTGDVLTWMPLADLGIADLLVQRIAAAHARGREDEVGAWAGTGAIVLGVVALVVGLLGVGLSAILPHLFDLPPADRVALQRAFAIAAASMSALVLYNGAFAYARAIQRPALLGAAATVATAAQFVVSLLFVVRGAGIDAIAFGFVARAAIQLIGVALFVVLQVPHDVRRSFRVSREVLVDMRRSVPATATAVLAYAGMNQSEMLIVSLLLGPSTATFYLLNRRAVDLARAFADTLTWGSFGAFAHLAGTDGRGRAFGVYREVLALRTAISIALGVGFLALNHSFVALWVGKAYVGGVALTACIAVQSIVTGGAFLSNYLYRAAGAVIPGSLLLAAESVSRIGLMALLAWLVGLPGVPLAGMLTGAVFFLLADRGLKNELVGAGERSPVAVDARFWWSSAALLLGAAFLGVRLVGLTWWTLGIAAVVLVGLSWVVLVLQSTSLRQQFVAFTARWRVAAAR